MAETEADEEMNMKDMKPLERAARALCGYQFDKSGNDHERRQEVVDRRWRMHLAEARIVIEAIRKPSDSMIFTVAKPYIKCAQAAFECWEEMIDDILLSEPEQ